MNGLCAAPRHSAEQPPATQASLLQLFAAFFRLGLTAFGGPAMVAYIRQLAVQRKSWLSGESFKYGVALCQAIPGATAMQTAAYVGSRVKGVRGAAAAYLGFGLPAFLLMLALSFLYQRSQAYPVVHALFRGLQAMVVAIVAEAVISFGRNTLKLWRDYILAGAAAILFGIGISPIITIFTAALAGMAFYSGAGETAPGASEPVTGGHRHLIPPAVVLIAIVAAGAACLFALDRDLFRLAALMLKVDLFAFGGGYASVPLMLHEVVEVRHWLDGRTFMDGIALGQVTPGPIVITATFVGYQIGGFWGAVVGTVAIFSPSFIILIIAVPNFDRLRHATFFLRALHGILVSFVGMLLSVAVKFGWTAPWTAGSVVLAAAALVALRLKVDILWVVLAGAALSALGLL